MMQQEMTSDYDHIIGRDDVTRSDVTGDDVVEDYVIRNFFRFPAFVWRR